MKKAMIVIGILFIIQSEVCSDPILDLFRTNESTQILDKGIFTNTLEKKIGLHLLQVKHKLEEYDFYIDDIFIVRLNIDQLPSVLRMSQFGGSSYFNLLNPPPKNIKIAYSCPQYNDTLFHQIYIVFYGNNEWQEAICILIPHSSELFYKPDAKKYYFIERSPETIYWLLENIKK